MCNYCKADQATINAVELWAANGMSCTRSIILVRPSAVKYPNTFIFVYQGAVQIGGTLKDVYIDAHYQGTTITPGAARDFFGGLWIPGVNGDMKPEQHGGNLLTTLQARVPATAPSTGISAVWGDKTGTKPLPLGLSH